MAINIKRIINQTHFFKYSVEFQKVRAEGDEDRGGTNLSSPHFRLRCSAVTKDRNFSRWRERPHQKQIPAGPRSRRFLEI